MSFRDETEALRAKNEVLEKKLFDAVTELSKGHKDAPKPPKRRSFWKPAIILGLVCGTIAGLSGNCLWQHEAESRDRQRRAAAEYEVALDHLRHETPAGVDQNLWQWCLAHCAQHGTYNGDTYAEGIITESYTDLRTAPPTQLMTVVGPRMREGYAVRMTYEILPNLVDPPGTSFHVGDLVHIQDERHGPSVTYHFHLIRPPAEAFAH